MNQTVAMRTAGTIIAGRFDTFDDAEAVKARLVRAAFPAASISVFFNNPPGRHDLTEIGGDEHADPEAKHAAGGAVAGAAAGAGLGLAAAATGPFGVAALAATGAYVGSLAGAMNATDHDAPSTQPLRRPSRRDAWPRSPANRARGRGDPRAARARRRQHRARARHAASTATGPTSIRSRRRSWSTRPPPSAAQPGGAPVTRVAQRVPGYAPPIPTRARGRDRRRRGADAAAAARARRAGERAAGAARGRCGSPHDDLEEGRVDTDCRGSPTGRDCTPELAALLKPPPRGPRKGTAS